MLESNAKFLTRNFGEPSTAEFMEDEGLSHNAQHAEKHLGIPRSMWVEYSKQIRARAAGIENRIEGNARAYESLIMAGFAMGWREAKAQK